jgi:hypothetical protein
MKAELRIVVALGIILMPPAVFGQATALWQPAKAEKPESERSVPIVLHPSPVPVPSLKYQLLPPFPERRPGNAAVWWNRIPAEQTGFFSDFNKQGGEWEKIEKWMEIPLGDPREKESRAKVHVFQNRSLFSDMDRAARFESCDWELPFREGSVIEMLLPELQQTRNYGRALSAKARLEIAEGRYGQAVHTLQTGFALAQHVAKGATLIHALVGTAIATMMSDRIQEMIQQPDSPNLYWALSTLPRPLVDFRPGFDVETNMLCLELPVLQDLDKKELTRDQWRELLLKLVGALRQWGNGGFKSEADVLVMTGLSLQGYPQAKQYLVERGRSAAEVEAMPVAQVIVLYTVQVYNELRDDQFKWLFLPYGEASKGMERSERSLREAVAARREIIPIASLLLPAVNSCKQAETRISWRIAQLRVLESLRLFAASHGRLPDRLDEIASVPVPSNPFDGKPFTYRRDGNKADLGCEEAGPRNIPWRCEITLKGNGK